MQFETIKYEVSDRILTITLNRPERMNAFTSQMAEELVRAVDMADEDDGVRAIIVTGEGRAFCAGADLGKGADTFNYDAEAEGEPDWNEVRDTGGVVTLRFFNSLKPVIGAINGPAVGVGATMMLPMDIRVAVDSAKIGFVFCRRGIVNDGAASWLLPKVVGIGQSLEWVLTGRVFSAEEGLRGGLLRSLHSADELMDVARSLAKEIADNTSAVSVAMARKMLWSLSGEPHPMAAHKAETRALFWAGRSADAKEGVMSFLEKRPAEFDLSAKKDLPPGFPWWDEPEFK